MANEETAFTRRREAAETSGRADSGGPLAARLLVTLVAIVTMAGAYLADWNATHIYNPRWPPHAKFHNAQTMLLASALGACALAYAWRRDPGGAHLRTAILFASLYWFAQLGSIAFPGTAFADPESAGKGLLLGLPGQLVIEVALLGLLGAALLFSRPRSSSDGATAGGHPSSEKRPS